MSFTKFLSFKLFFSGFVCLLWLTLLLGGCGDETSAGKSISFEFPGVSGAKQVNLEKDLYDASLKQFGVNDANLAVFVSDDTIQSTAQGLEKYLTSNGYTVSQTTGQSSSQYYTGGYTNKSTGLDLVQDALPVPLDPAKTMRMSGVSDASIQKYVEQVKGKKTLVTILYGKSLIQNMVKSGPTIAPVVTGIKGGFGSGSTPTPAK